jgi:hypothetical protein
MTIYIKESLLINQKSQELLNYIENEARSLELHEVENGVFHMLLSLGKLLMEKFVEDKGVGKESASIQHKGESLPYHSLKSRKYLSIFGSISITRAYYWKAGFEGVYPLDSALNLPKRHHSYLLEGWIQRRVTEEPYQEAIGSIADLLNLKVCKRTTQQITREASQEVENFYKQKTDFEEEGSCIIAQADCKGVIMVPKERPEKIGKTGFVRRAKGSSKIGIRKDAVVTAEYSLNPAKRTPTDVLEGLMLINSDKEKEKKIEKSKEDRKPINKQATATMYGKEHAFVNLADRIHARDLDDSKSIYVLTDGALSLKRGLLKEFEKRGWGWRVKGFCLDIVHVTEYLWDASTALYGEIDAKRVSWVRSRLEKILNSNVGEVITEIKNKIETGKLSLFIMKRLKRTMTYLSNHIEMMDYKEYLEAGFPIASGAIEGACNSLVKDRTDRSGMQWTKKGAQGVISLRSVQCNKDWDSYWEYYIKKESKNLYGNYQGCMAA